MAKKKQAKTEKKHPGGRPPLYPFDKWTDGRQHTIDYKRFGVTREAMTEALRRQARRLKCSVNIYQCGGTELDIKFNL